MGTQKLQTTWYNPQTNGQCKGFNSTLIGMLRTLSPEQKLDWKGSIGALAPPITALGILPWVSVHIFLCVGGNPIFQLMIP